MCITLPNFKLIFVKIWLVFFAQYFKLFNLSPCYLIRTCCNVDCISTLFYLQGNEWSAYCISCFNFYPLSNPSWLFNKKIKQWEPETICYHSPSHITCRVSVRVEASSIFFTGADWTHQQSGPSLWVCWAMQWECSVESACQGSAAAVPGQGGHRFIHQGWWPHCLYWCGWHGSQDWLVWENQAFYR